MDYLTGLEGKLDATYTEGRRLADEHAKYSNDVPFGRPPTLQEPSSVDPLHEARVSEAGGDQGPGRAGRRDAGDTSPAEDGSSGDAGQPDGLADQPGKPGEPAQDDARAAPTSTIPPELSEQIAALERDFADAADHLDPDAQAELARIGEADQAAQSVLGGIAQAATCMLGGLA
jgi:hypothetical protein